MTLSYYDRYSPPDLKETVERAVATLAPHAASFDCIAVRGVSGMIVGAPVALALGKPLVVVRKPHETSHGQSLANRRHAGGRFLVLDDFMFTGATVQAIRDSMEGNAGAEFAGIYMYQYDEYKRK